MPQDELSAADTPSQSSNQPGTDDRIHDPDIDAAKAAWESVGDPESHAVSEDQLQRAREIAEPYVGRWNTLISTTNWEKGRIISEWRSELIESGVDATQYSDDAWARRVGGVTAPHVGRLRRVYDRFADSYESYSGLYWSHFLAALDWQDAPLWLEGASKESWSISAMREQRWQAEGAVESQRPTDSQIVTVDTDEDVTLPAQGGGKSREYDGDSGGVAAGPAFEGPDFGDEEELQALPGQERPSGTATVDGISEPSDAPDPVQPFIGLPPLPDDLCEAIESLKLAILRHKSDQWRDVDAETVQRYLNAVNIMLQN